MKPTLAKLLIENGIIRYGTVFEVYHNTKGISGQYDSTILDSFRLIGAQSIGEWVYFVTLGSDNNQHRIRCDYVISVDGMPISRLAESHSFNENGEDVKTVRRGRRKKILEEDEDDDYE
jgi:hypothetical protein